MMSAPAISCTFVGGPLDGQRLPVASNCGSYWCTSHDAIHVYYRRSHPSAYRRQGDDTPVVSSPPIFDHQPELTKGRTA